MKKFYLIFLFTLPLLLFSQGENNNWHFGWQAAINFSTSTPTIVNNSAINALEACGSVSDSNGNLLFYMNGEKIWNRQNQVMPNGVLIPPFQNDSAEQLAIVKNPANSNQYYVFTTGENTSTGSALIRITYSIVDMTLGSIGGNGYPLGDVVQGSKTINVLNNLGNIFESEAVTIVPNGNNSFWVLIPNGTQLYSYKLDNSGFDNGNPVISNLNFPVNLNLNKYYSIKASPIINNNNYSHYLCVSYWLDYNNQNVPDGSYMSKVYSFNAATGQITNDYSLQINGKRAYLPEFNKNASVLFLGYKNLHAVDLVNSTSSAVYSTEIYHDSSPVSVWDGMGIQRNKYGDIYVSKYGSSFLGQIINPDNYGSGISLNLTAINLNNGITQFSLPQLIPKFEKAPVEEYYPCIADLTLNTPEPHTLFTYNVANDIVTEDDYLIPQDYDITMIAGNSITLKPNTYIEAHHFLAKIANCDPRATKSERLNKKLNQRGMILELDKSEREVLRSDDIKVFPNPVTDILTINSKSEIENVEIYDMSGKRFSVNLNNNRVIVNNLSAGVYNISIKTKSGIITKKIIKK